MFTMPTSDVTITVTIAEKLSVTIGDVENVTITLSYGDDSALESGEKVSANTVIKVSATAAPGYLLDKIYINGVEHVAETYTVTSATVVTATVTEIPMSTIAEALAATPETENGVSSSILKTSGIVKEISGKNTTITDGENDIIIYSPSLDAGQTIALGDTVVVVGYTKNYYGTKEFAWANNTNVKIISIEHTDREISAVVLDGEGAASSNATIVGLPDPAIAKSASTVTFSVDNITEGYKVFVTLNGISLSETNGEYSFVVGYEVNIVVTVIQEGEVTTLTIEKTIAMLKTENGWSNSAQYSSFALDENVTVSATGGSNTGKYYDSGSEWRIYQTETPTVTISVNGGEIVSVIISYSVKNTGVLTYNGQNISSGTEIEVNGISSITFGVGNTTDEVTNGQVKITGFTVVYKK